jgi:hypothetical protein
VVLLGKGTRVRRLKTDTDLDSRFENFKRNVVLCGTRIVTIGQLQFGVNAEKRWHYAMILMVDCHHGSFVKERRL